MITLLNIDKYSFHIYVVLWNAVIKKLVDYRLSLSKKVITKPIEMKNSTINGAKYRIFHIISPPPIISPTPILLKIRCNLSGKKAPFWSKHLIFLEKWNYKPGIKIWKIRYQRILNYNIFWCIYQGIRIVTNFFCLHQRISN